MNIVKSIRIIVLAVSVVSLATCTYKKYDEIKPGGCEVTSITYENTIKTILNNKCVSCHGSSSAIANVRLHNYSEAIITARDGRLVSSIKGINGFQKMPPNGDMTDCQIKQIEAWIAQGSKEN
ncbi:MAG: c-type cytochrome [Bacteroidota bacterium]|nr:c-type cytochrome [Bacteroidota bacterium]